MSYFLRVFAPIILSAALFTLSGCALFKPFKQPIEQGPIITDKQIQSLKPGMTKSQVSYVLGSANIVPAFSSNAWYYVYTNQVGDKPRTTRTLVVHFSKTGKLSNISGNYVPPTPIEYATYNSQ